MQDLPNHMTKIFDPRPQIKVKDISDININVLLLETYTITTIMTEKKNQDNQSVSVRIQSWQPVRVGAYTIYTTSDCVVTYRIKTPNPCPCLQRLYLTGNAQYIYKWSWILTFDPNFWLQYNLIPKSQYSLKVLAELPIIVVLMYQLYKHHVQADIPDFIPMIMNTITLQPSATQRYVQLWCQQ